METDGPLRVLVVNWQDRLNPQAGGAELHLHEVFGRLARRGHHVTLLCSGWGGAAERDRIDGIEVHRTGGRHTFNLAAPLYYRRELATEPFDVIVEDLNKVPMLAPRWGQAQVAVLLVHHLFGLEAFREAHPLIAIPTWLSERAVPFLYRRLPCVAVSESTREDLVRRGLDASRITVIHNGVDLDGLYPSSPRYPSPTIAYLGRLKRYKRIDLIIRAVAVLGDRGVDVELVIAGKGDARPRLEAVARRLRLDDRVRFLGFVSEEEKREILARAWVHALTSPKEGWGIASMEASACGTPTVASDAPGLRETVRHGETGELVPHGDVPALADALERVMLKGTRDRMGRAARRMAEQYSWDDAADAFERLLGHVVSTGVDGEPSGLT